MAASATKALGGIVSHEQLKHSTDNNSAYA